VFLITLLHRHFSYASCSHNQALCYRDVGRLTDSTLLLEEVAEGLKSAGDPKLRDCVRTLREIRQLLRRGAFSWNPEAHSRN